MNGIVQIPVKAKSTLNFIKITRSISSLSRICKQNEKLAGNFVPVYKFPYVVPLSIINRLKLYYTALTAISVPGSIALNILNQISSDAVQYTAALSGSGCLVLYSIGYLVQNFIGFIYYNEEKDIAKISYIDFWGKRKDIEVPTQDIVPINDLPVTPFNGLFFTIRRFSTKETLKLNLQFGTVLDKEKIKQVL